MSHWPHAPSHEVNHAGAFIVTASTLDKVRYFDSPEKLNLLERSLLSMAEEFGWKLQAWAVFSNHYHFVGLSPEEGSNLGKFTSKLQAGTAWELNRLDGNLGRRVWYRCWDTRLSFERSYLARLSYVHHNPVKHGLVRAADTYPYCSAQWFKLRSRPAFYETVVGFPCDKVEVVDDF
jgi:putative transposase